MAIWILQLPLLPDEERALTAQEYLTMPDRTMPDFTRASGKDAIKRYLRDAMPDTPPESLEPIINRIWRFTHEALPEDIVAIVLKDSKELACAEVTAICEYRQLPDGSWAHVLPVFWRKSLPMRLFKQYEDELAPRENWFREAPSPQLRTLIRDKLRLPATRFARWKWILGILILMKLTLFSIHMLKREEKLLGPPVQHTPVGREQEF